MLTCKRCNNYAGSKFDAQAYEEQQLWQFLSGHSEQPQTAAFTIGNITTNVEMHVTGQTGMFFMEVPKINDPANVKHMEERMRMLSETRNTNFRFTVTPRLRYFPDRARVSWIRAAYLATFALFGWKYIMQPALQPIREQLMNPSTITLPLLSTYDPNGDSDRHEIWAIKKPPEHRSLLVIWGQHGVFLPVPNDPRSLEELSRNLGARPEKPICYSFTGDMFPWPSRPEHLLDPAPITA